MTFRRFNLRYLHTYYNFFPIFGENKEYIKKDKGIFPCLFRFLALLDIQ